MPQQAISGADILHFCSPFPLSSACRLRHSIGDSDFFFSPRHSNSGRSTRAFHLHPPTARVTLFLGEYPAAPGQEGSLLDNVYCEPITGYPTFNRGDSMRLAALDPEAIAWQLFSTLILYVRIQGRSTSGLGPFSFIRDIVSSR